MIFKCKNCGGVIEYSVEKDRMVCGYCRSEFRVDELTQSSYSGETELEESIEEEEIQQPVETDFIKMQIVRCTACGAELAVNGVETSTFCAYCGQATVIKDRIDNVLKPNYIIPFKVTKNEAERIIRDELNKGYYIPEAIKNFEVEKIRGIYVPFWMFDIRYKDFQYWIYENKYKKERVEYVEAEAFFEKITLDASSQLDDDTSVRLEPYDMRELRGFDMAYLSGYYSDRFDVKVNDVHDKAISRVKEYFNKLAEKRLKHEGGWLAKSSPIHKVTKTEYALLPVWFLTFNFDNKPYTILVNGQTGKMVGAVPAVRSKVYLTILLAFLVLFGFGMISFSLLYKVINAFSFAINAIIILIMILIGRQKYDEFKKSISLTTEVKTNRYMKERQDR